MPLSDYLPNSPLKGPPTPRAWGQTWGKVAEKAPVKFGGVVGGTSFALLSFIAIETLTALTVPLPLAIATATGGGAFGTGIGTGVGGVIVKAGGK